MPNESKKYVTITFGSYVRIISGSYIVFWSENYVIKSCKLDQKIRNHYIMAYVIIMSLSCNFASWVVIKPTIKSR